MYQPPLHREDRLDVLHDLIRRRPLGLLVSSGPEGPVADQLPFLLDAERSPNGTLRAHMARANAQWRILQESPAALVIFQGLNAYITPSWYATKRETGKVVPTWNYVIVQARGQARIIDDRDWLAQQISDLTEKQEAPRREPWAVSDAPEAFIDAQIKGIIGLEIEIAAVEGKWKVSQNRPAADRQGVIDGLGRDVAADEAAGMAELVRSFGPK